MRTFWQKGLQAFLRAEAQGAVFGPHPGPYASLLGGGDSKLSQKV